MIIFSQVWGIPQLRALCEYGNDEVLWNDLVAHVEELHLVYCGIFGILSRQILSEMKLNHLVSSEPA